MKDFAPGSELMYIKYACHPVDIGSALTVSAGTSSAGSLLDREYHFS
jgi:hypothetical protein